MARVTRGDVGERVSIRRWLHEVDGEVGDVLGHLVDWSDDDVLTIEKRDGETVTTPAALVLASKLIPPAPPRRTSRTPS